MTRPTFPDEFNLATTTSSTAWTRTSATSRQSSSAIASRHTPRSPARSPLRSWLAVAGVAREQRVLIILHDTPAFAWAFFATLHQGAVVAMGNPEAPVADLAYLVEYTRAAAVVTIPRVADAIADALRDAEPCTLILVPEVQTGGDVESEAEVPPSVRELGPVVLRDALAQGTERMRAGMRPPRRTRRDDMAIWLFTSGSTGKSKANVHTHRDFAFNTEVYAKGTVGYRKDDVTVSVPRLFFGYATGTNLMFPFAVGATTALFAERPTPESLMAAIDRHQPTIVTNVPTMMGKLLDHDDARAAAGDERLDLSSVRFHLSPAGAAADLLSRFMERSAARDDASAPRDVPIYCRTAR